MILLYMSLVCISIRRKEMTKAYHTVRSMFKIILVFVILAGLKQGFAKAQIRSLPPEEVSALHEIANQLGKKDWNFSVNPCDENDPNISNWNNSVICNCSYPGGICHVESMFLTGQDLDGVLPKSLAKLPYIKQIDFTRNYLHGTIPREWVSTKLEYLSVAVNGLSGPIPGVLLDGTIIAVKQLSSKSNQGSREFVNEIGMISGLRHPNLVRLHGCCTERKQLLLVYEFMENNSLARALFGPEKSRLDLDWATRQNICIDKDLEPKISDFGLAKLDDEENTHISTRVAGTIGYMAPEYALWGYLTDKADVYSFGIVALEIVAGKNNMKHRPNQNFGNQSEMDPVEQNRLLLEMDFGGEDDMNLVQCPLYE
ncbi:hypothetical protein POM88_025103 [Heracleum sosnowskyi]|uniref:Protein kinase domain-containing protein n=1 Tax=Heracleum sosnowskyi TaxID=360622 RepID=A0AAD8I4N5_9APIA|nr:hypothetical protein POM88_025103 [Heracleum sosnowskyi]